ncbi:hypothetical protein CEXT_675961 [Caerostris extrusa]|uniref:Uncharacterized protein n=1 Tax=Caerostris extrusa TaxID=172846 RepID=A0AAV4NIA8_CAEEX|nr:hypothetical protein CEXT_675961 [Caerostris extrusa]
MVNDHEAACTFPFLYLLQPNFLRKSVYNLFRGSQLISSKVTLSRNTQCKPRMAICWECSAYHTGGTDRNFHGKQEVVFPATRPAVRHRL